MWEIEFRQSCLFIFSRSGAKETTGRKKIIGRTRYFYRFFIVSEHV